MRKLIEKLRITLFGSWLRVISTAIVVTNAALIGLALMFLLFAGRETLFRVDAISDLVTFVTSAELEWGEAPVRARDVDKALCPSGGVKVPVGTSITARRLNDGVSVGLDAPGQDHPILVNCTADDSRPVSFVELWFPQPTIPLVNDKALLTGNTYFRGLQALGQNEPPRASMVVSGRLLRVGGEGDPNSPVTDPPLLHSGTLSSETSSWPIKSSAVVVDRALQPGDIVSFDQPGAKPDDAQGLAPNASPEFTGILLVEDGSLRIIARTEASAALLTSPNAPVGKPAIVAPTILARLQAQAEWGVFLLIGGLMLSILSALRSLVMEEEKMFEWVPGKPKPTPKSTPKRSRGGSVKGTTTAIVLAYMGISQIRPATAQAVADHPVFRISVKGGSFGQGFAILNPRGTPACLIVTAEHVAEAGDEITLVGEQPSSVNGQAVPIVASARYLDMLAPGLIVLQPDPKAQLGSCAPMPQLTRSDNVFETDGFGRLTYAENNGERRTLKVLVDGDPRLPDRLSAMGLTSVQISPGLSGSPMSINGKILAIVNSVDNGLAELIRLDTITPNPRYLAAAPVAAVTWKPAWDVSRLPAIYRDVALAARALATKAAGVQRVAMDNERRANTAAQAARDNLTGYGTAVLKETDRVFEGKIDNDNIPNGWGVLRFTDGARVGDEVRGLFRRDGNSFAASGASVMTYADPAKSNNQVRMDVGMSPTANGPGVLAFSDGAIVWRSWVNGGGDSVQTYRSGVDKSAWEVTTKNGVFNGPGIYWTVDGQPLCICVWKDGKVIKDETKTFAGP